MSPQQVRRKLDAVGRRRKKLEKEIEELRGDTVKAVQAAKVCRDVTMEEAADRAGLTRTTLYQVYLKDGQDAQTTRQAPAAAR